MPSLAYREIPIRESLRLFEMISIHFDKNSETLKPSHLFFQQKRDLTLKAKSRLMFSNTTSDNNSLGDAPVIKLFMGHDTRYPFSLAADECE
jgi:hypothetical protein